MARTSELEQVWPSTIVDAAMPVGALSAFAVAAVTTPLVSDRVDRVVLCLLVLIVSVVGLLAGRVAAVFPSLMAAFSFDFFHVEPIRVLHPRALVASLALFLVIGLVSGTRRRPRTDVGGRSISTRQDAETHR